VSDARATALDMLGQVLDRRRPLDELIERHRGFAQLEARDRGFVRLIVATCLRRLGQIDALIAHAMERPLPENAAAARNLLRIGVCQLVFLEVPPHAAVGETVALATEIDHGRYKALANAVLRRLAREGGALVAGQDAARLNTPDWLWQGWSAAYGEAACRAIAEAHLQEAPLDLGVKSDAPLWAERLGAQILPTGSLRRAAGGDIRALPGYDEGAWWVQDAAAALPARLLGDVRGKRVIDLCAAPGGKTAQLALAGARVTALDRSPARIVRLAQNLHRLELEAELVTAEAGAWRPSEPADAVLLDAPCSATGTIRRHPDVAHLKTAEDVSRMAAEQDRLLRAASDMLRQGGILVYATCSLEPAEGSERTSAILAAGLPLAHRPISAEEFGWPEELVTPQGDLRTLPFHLAALGGLDGFYAARFERL
jgi:16S rRNA (cytosine967-C5)-methyltransferase